MKPRGSNSTCETAPMIGRFVELMLYAFVKQEARDGGEDMKLTLIISTKHCLKNFRIQFSVSFCCVKPLRFFFRSELLLVWFH